MSTRTTPIQAILSGFYTTVIINVISWGKAYALFPYSTFIRRDGVLLRKRNEYIMIQLQKYQQRGWTIEASPPVEDKELRREFARNKLVGDQSSFIMPFNTDGIAPPRVPDAILENIAFRIQRNNFVAAAPDLRYYLQFLHT